ncbi:hypothetical protein [Natrononativus amylolyticus]|uniref:hypothetical protein n=1 Tax=Natrononativus amylolyticus TaxID=2963434 RepID=UPI0020CDC363|nr:hypothetical protein [Natrononativus amylolyticus]
MSKRARQAGDPDGEAINWRQTASGVTVYDEENPDAWVHMEFKAGVPPEHRLYMVCDECGSVFAQRGKPGSGTRCGECGALYDHGD